MKYVLIIVPLVILSSATGVSTQEILAFNMVVNHSRCSAPRQAVMEGETVHFTSVLKATGVNLTIFWRYILFSEGDSIHDMTYYIGFIVLAKCDGKRGEDRPDRGMVAGACWMDGDNIRTYLEIKASTKYNASKVYMLWCGPGLYLKSARIAFPVVLQKEYMTLTVNSQDVSLREGVLPLKPNRSNYVILCTINMVRPHIRASFNGELFESPVDCLKHSISVTSAGIGLSYHVNVEERGGDCERTINSTLVVRKDKDAEDRRATNACKTIQSECKELVWFFLWFFLWFVVMAFLKSQ